MTPKQKYDSLKPVLFDSTGKMKTTGLFEETKFASNKTPAPFKLSDWHETYIAILDPTEYTQALEILGSWEHWQALRGNETLAKHFDNWKVEVEIKIRAEAVRNLIVQSKTPSGSTAAKWLAEAGFNPKDMRFKKSRDTEDRIRREMQEQVESDFERLTTP